MIGASAKTIITGGGHVTEFRWFMEKKNHKIPKQVETMKIMKTLLHFFPNIGVEHRRGKNKFEE